MAEYTYRYKKVKLISISDLIASYKNRNIIFHIHPLIQQNNVHLITFFYKLYVSVKDYSSDLWL